MSILMWLDELLLLGILALLFLDAWENSRVVRRVRKKVTKWRMQ